MNTFFNRWFSIAILAISCSSLVCLAEDIPQSDIAELEQKLAESKEAKSAARKKLAMKRVLREGDSLLDENAEAANRFEVLDILFRGRQQLLGLDGSSTNRRALLETARLLAAAPNDYAAIRLDADLLLSQAELAQKGADLEARGAALIPLVDRYQGTTVEAKVIRIAMNLALEFGDARLITYLRQIIAERSPGDLEMINFQRDKLAGQVFGAPFVGKFKGSDGKAYRFPMDGMGKSTALYFWSKENGGIEQIKAMAEGWKELEEKFDRDGRYQFISFNLDDLPDAGESLLREAGIDWPAMHLPGGKENPIYKTYVRVEPKLLTMTPTGYSAMVMSGSTRVRPDRGWASNFGSSLSRSWTNARYTSEVQSLLSGDFLVIEPIGAFDPADPPEWKAVKAAAPQQSDKLKRSANSVPEEELIAIQACLVKPPLRNQLRTAEVRANYAKCEQLCRKAIAEHSDADDLWIVRNRLIVSLMGRWKAEGKRAHFDSAISEANAAIEAGYPDGIDIIARFCLTREALRNADSDLPDVIESFVAGEQDKIQPATANALASLLALEIGDRRLHERYRRASLDQYAETPALWIATSFLLDRYHRYWLYHPPFTAGWTYGRRQGHFLAIGTPEDAKRSIELELTTLDGETVRFPEDSNGKWTIIEFRPDSEANPHLNRYGTFINQRPFEDIRLVVAVLDDKAEATRAAVTKRNEENTKRKRPLDHFDTMILPGGVDNPVVQKLGILNEDNNRGSSIVMIRPDGSIAAMLSNHSSNAMQNVIEYHDEKAVDDALASGDLEEAQRIAFAHAPVTQEPPPDAPRNWRPKKIGTVHRRARAKVFAAMENWEPAVEDIEEVYLQVFNKSGWLSMRTEDLEYTEKLKTDITAASGQATPE